MMRVALLLFVGCATALRLPSAPVRPPSAGSMSRRELTSVAASAAAAMMAVPLARAYDALPTVDADFGKIEKLRLEREEAARLKKAEINEYVKAIEASTNKQQFIEAADKFAIFVIGEGKFPEGINIKTIVKRISEAYEALPKVRYYCEATRTNQGVCYTAGADAQAAYDALIKEIRQYSLIVVGDYRTVTFKAF